MKGICLYDHMLAHDFDPTEHPRDEQPTVPTHSALHIHASSTVLRKDPTRTLTLREAWARELGARYDRLKKAIRKAVVEDDVFGLNERPAGGIFANEFDESEHPRDEDGRFTDGGSWKAETSRDGVRGLYYHGSSSDVIESVLKDGLRTGIAEPLVLGEGRVPNVTFLTPERRIAEAYAGASRVPGSTGVIFEVRVPREQKIEKDPTSTQGSVFIRRAVPSEWIVAYSVKPRGADIWERKIRVNEDGQTYFVVVWATPTSNLKTHSCSPLHIHASSTVHASLTPGAFAFKRSPEKVSGFMRWLRSQVNQGILGVAEGPEMEFAADKVWTSKYIQAAYKRGMARGVTEMQKAGIPATSPVDGSRAIDSAFLRPIHADRVGMLYTRAWEELRGAAGRLEQKAQRVLSEQLALGMAEGRGPLDIARDLEDTLGLEQDYARTLARTEVIRAHHSALIGTYREAGVSGVSVMAEWATAGHAVCPDCADLQGRVFTLDEIEGLIPAHPNCRCCALPAGVGEAAGSRGKFDEDTIGEDYRDAGGNPDKPRGLFEKAVQGEFEKPGRRLRAHEGTSEGAIEGIPAATSGTAG